jgi:hypothetical protein
MKKKKKSLFSVLVLALPAFLALGGCTNEEMPSDMLNADAGSISVVTAVQLGAEPGCSGMSGRVSGNITMIKLAEDRELALLLQDGDPLCVDTIGAIKEELASIEGSLVQEALGDVPVSGGGGGGDYGDLMREAREGEGLEQNNGSSDSGTVPVKFDPDPQPALKSSVGVSVTSASGSTVTANPSTGGGTSNPNPSGGTPSAPHGN